MNYYLTIQAIWGKSISAESEQYYRENVSEDTINVCRKGTDLIVMYSMERFMKMSPDEIIGVIPSVMNALPPKDDLIGINISACSFGYDKIPRELEGKVTLVNDILDDYLEANGIDMHAVDIRITT